MPGTQSGADVPDFVAFRLAEGGELVTVSAALGPGDRTGFPWARWYSEQTPDAEFKKVPMDYAHFWHRSRRRQNDDRFD